MREKTPPGRAKLQARTQDDDLHRTLKFVRLRHLSQTPLFKNQPPGFPTNAGLEWVEMY